MRWTVTITGLSTEEGEMDAHVLAIAAFLDTRGFPEFVVSAKPLATGLAGGRKRPAQPWRMSADACPECGSQAGLHALSCRHYPEVPAEPEYLSGACVAELRSLPAFQWHGWPPDGYDEGLPVVEIRQDHLAALLGEIDSWRSAE